MMLPCSRFRVPQHWPPTTSVSSTVYMQHSHAHKPKRRAAFLFKLCSEKPPYTGVKMTTLNVLKARLSTICSMRTAKPCRSSSFVMGPHSHGSLSRSTTAVYKVKLLGPNGEEAEFDAPKDVHILDSAESAGLKLPHLCRSGACSTCTGLMVSVGGSIGGSVPR
ncbi:unnamed protein product [Prunus armeniaca]|uniref:2Fe-2S ferredoxin-type domain-containing protein n=1 Tax=Prunus armeniaca TaxID=36596 RepID=A0A6J5VZG8_PRUAR|nr:unnamed protein product [Prunus armeniaca]